jgi:hypothetical protein
MGKTAKFRLIQQNLLRHNDACFRSNVSDNEPVYLFISSLFNDAVSNSECGVD